MGLTELGVGGIIEITVNKPAVTLHKERVKTLAKNVIKLKLDIIFKKTFTENSDLLQSLLMGLLNLPKIDNIVIKNSEILPNGIDGKFVRMDLNLEADGKLINVEMQYGADMNYKDRALLYWSKLYESGSKSGKGYGELQPSISVNIVNHSIFDCKEYHSSFTMMERQRHEILSDKCEIHFFELKKIGKAINVNDKAELWLKLINAETEEELEMLEQTGFEPIQKAARVIRDMSEDTRIREMARAREEAEINERLMLGAARKEGRQEGRREVLKEVIDNLKNSGMSDDDIKRILKL